MCRTKTANLFKLNRKYSEFTQIWIKIEGPFLITLNTQYFYLNQNKRKNHNPLLVIQILK